MAITRLVNRRVFFYLFFFCAFLSFINHTFSCICFTCITILHSSVKRPSFANGNTASKLSFCERSKFGTKKIFGILAKSNCSRSETKKNILQLLK